MGVVGIKVERAVMVPQGKQMELLERWSDNVVS